MTAVSKPVPVFRGEERIYFERARQRQLVYQVCDDCGQLIFYLRTVCPACMSMSLTIRESAGRGVVYSYTTQYRPGNPAFADDVPYSIVLVDLDEGVRVLADLVDCEIEDIAIGISVEVLFDDLDEELALPRFRPVTSGGESA